MKDLIDQITKIEEASERTKLRADEEKEKIDERVRESMKQFDESCEEETQERLRKVRETCAARSDADLRGQREKTERLIAELETAYTSSHTQLADAIVKRITENSNE